MILDILKKIKKLKVKELKELAHKLEIIKKKRFNEYYCKYLKYPEDKSISYSDTYLLFDDLGEALTYCIYHFEGGRLESKDGEENCPCLCLCTNCELLPESPVLVRMQEIGQNIAEENVFNEFIEKYGKKENIGQSGQTFNTDNIGSNS